MVFTLTHFKAFDYGQPLIEKEFTIENTYVQFQFSERSQVIMQNWEDIHECEDECDHERMRKKASVTAESLAMNDTINQTFLEDDIHDGDVVLKPTQISGKDFVVLQTIHILEQSQWLVASKVCKEKTTVPSMLFNFPTPTTQQLKEWMNSIKHQEQVIAQKCRMGDNVQHLTMELFLMPLKQRLKKK
jgi:hypothetical protein